MGQVAVALDGRALRRQRLGWYAYGWASQPFETTVVTVFMSRYLPVVAQNAVGRNGRLRVLGLPILPGSLFAYVVSACSVLLVVLMPLVGAVADRTGCKRGLLLGLGYGGAASCAAMVFVGRTDWILGALLFASAFVSYSCARVVYNSLLPDLAEPDLRDRVSSVGWAAGYLGGGILLAMNFGGSLLIGDSTVLARLSLCSAGLWWAVFLVVPLRILRDLPSSAIQRGPIVGSVFTSGFRELGDTLCHVRNYRVTLLFLVAFLVYYDGISTVTTLSADY
ncbi:MAG: MFS transporter, partial [Pseudonocardiales bacterium]|nr:MFS transporter [Pseudonocardiales bacterium]